MRITDRGGRQGSHYDYYDDFIIYDKNISYLIVNNGFLIDKLIIKHKIVQITLVCSELHIATQSLLKGGYHG